MPNEVRAAKRRLLLPYVLLFASCALSVGFGALHEDKPLASVASPASAVFSIVSMVFLLWLIHYDSRAPFKTALLIVMMLDTLQNYGRTFIGRPEMTGIASAVDNGLWMIALVYLYECYRPATQSAQ